MNDKAQSDSIKKEMNEMMHKARENIAELTRELGYKPFVDVKVVLEDANTLKVKGTCPLCAKVVTFDSPDDISVYSEITHPGDEKKAKIKINACPHCTISRKNSLPTKGRLLNELGMSRLNKIVDSKFGGALVPIKGNLFSDPNELVVFKAADGKKYTTKYKTLLAYSNISFEDIDDEFRADANDVVFSIKGDDILTQEKGDDNGEKFIIDSLLLNVEKDQIYFSNSESKVEDTTKTIKHEAPPKEEPKLELVIEPEPEPEEEPDVPEDDDDDVGADEVFYPEEDENGEEDGSDTDYDESGEETVSEEDDEVSTDNDEIGEEDTPEEEIQFNSTVVETEFDDESYDPEDNDQNDEYENEVDESVEEDENEIDIDTISESFNNPEVETISLEAEVEEKVVQTSHGCNYTICEDGSITLDLPEGESLFPFDFTSGVANKQDVTTPEVEYVDAQSEVNLDEEEDEHNFARLNEFEQDNDSYDDNVITLDLEPEVKKTKSKDEYKDYGAENRTDKIGEEAKKILEKDKKWYDKEVFGTDDYTDPINEFIDEEDLYKEFRESQLGKVVIDVTNISQLDATVLINESTCELPFVDYSSGVRVVCIDCDNISQMKVPVAFMEKSVKFSYPLQKGDEYRKVYLYSDTLKSQNRIKAAIKNLLKIVNRDAFDPRRTINLSGNYVLFYTDHVQTIRSFEDCNSSYPQGKPCTKSIGIIAMRSTDGKKKEFTNKDVMNYLAKNFKDDMESNNLYMVVSARYIVQPIHERKVVKYQITEYNELRSTLIKDGLDHVIGAIIKEHQANTTVKDPKNLGFDFSSYGYEFEFEFDSACLPSPSLEIWHDDEGFWKIHNSYEDGQGKCYIRINEYRTNVTDGYRNDPRLFLPIPLSKRFRPEIEKANANVMIESVRRQFIERIGFVEAYYPRIKRFMLSPLATMSKALMKQSVLTMSKIDLNKFFSGNGIYDGGYDNMLMQKFFMNNADIDENTKNMMNVLMIQNMIKK
ncbi:MAG: hypothetical protein ACRC5M_06910 [Anaeroplasmataceae bacterium]